MSSRANNTGNDSLAKIADILASSGYSPEPVRVDNRRLTDLVHLWFKLHGTTLKDATYRYSRTVALCESLGNPLAVDFTTEQFADYRIQRLKEVSVSTVNHETRYLRAVFNELKRLGKYHGENPLKNIRTFREKQVELCYLTQREINLLLSECDKSRNPHLRCVVSLALQTGARWSEANELQAQNLKPDYVEYIDTKNGTNRFVPIKPELYAYLKERGYRVRRGRLFSECNGAFRKAVLRSGIDLPRGQLTHVLRHTFASFQVMSGVDLVTLQRVLGHGDIRITMRYAHLAPDYLRRIVEYVPEVGC